MFLPCFDPSRAAPVHALCILLNQHEVIMSCIKQQDTLQTHIHQHKKRLNIASGLLSWHVVDVYWVHSGTVFPDIQNMFLSNLTPPLENR